VIIFILKTIFVRPLIKQLLSVDENITKKINFLKKKNLVLMPTFTFIEITSCPILVLFEEKATEVRFRKKNEAERFYIIYLSDR